MNAVNSAKMYIVIQESKSHVDKKANTCDSKWLYIGVYIKSVTVYETLLHLPLPFRRLV